MNDKLRIGNLHKLIEEARENGTQPLEAALQVAEAIEDLDDRTSYIAIVAKEFASIGTLADIDRAIELTRRTKPIDKWAFGFPGIFNRLVAENEIGRALETLGEFEIAAREFETDDGYDYATRSAMWRDLGNMYEKVGKIERARQMWFAAVKLAQIGQESQNPQDAVDSCKALVSLIRKFLQSGFTEDATKIANSITHGKFKEHALQIISESRDGQKHN
jgi:tetratricopeptide (TPR) repeat protein